MDTNRILTLFWQLFSLLRLLDVPPMLIKRVAQEVLGSVPWFIIRLAMKRQLRLITIFFAVLFVLFYQNNLSASNGLDRSLYFISGEPTPKMNLAFPSNLFTVDSSNGKLTKKVEIFSSQEGVEFIHPYYDGQFVLIKKLVESNAPDTPNQWRARFAKIDMNRPSKITYFEIVFPDMSVIDSHLFNIPDRGIFAGFNLRGDNSKKLIGINLDTFVQEELPWDFYKYIQVSGIPGGGTSGGDYISIYEEPGGNLSISQGGHIVGTNWTLSKSAHFPPKDRLVLFVNNDDILALSSIKTRNRDGLGSTPFWFFDKVAQKWHKVVFQGGSTGVRGFGPWIAGYVTGRSQGKSSPGKEKRRKEMSKSGLTADFRFEEIDQFSPGTLFLYNVQSRNKYVLNTDQGDSEVLLIDDNTVYYRVYDEIYKARIGKNKIEDAALLVKDDVVPDIHWAFMGPE